MKETNRVSQQSPIRYALFNQTRDADISEVESKYTDGNQGKNKNTPDRGNGN